MTEYVDHLLETVKLQLKKHERPVAHYNKSNKRITIIYDFNFGFIPKVKFIAHRDIWLQWFYNFDQTDFNAIKLCLSRPSKKTHEDLSQYANNYPRDFRGDMFKCIECAIFQHPKFPPAVKSRKPSQYDLTWREKNEISVTAIWLYLELRRLGNQPENKWPSYIKKFLKEYDIKNKALKQDLAIKESIIEIMKQYYGIDFCDRFWQTFVTESSISLKQVKKLKRIDPPKENPFLKPLFKEFITD
jgi:hypothetical protein